jgi:GNAT superfamily N-acetyltransferase
MSGCDVGIPDRAHSPLSALGELRQPVVIREAVEGDNEALLALTRSTPMAGSISLRIDRDPDFFALLRLRGEGKVYVAVRGREVVGCISAALRIAYVSGVPETVAYVGDMKVHPRFSGTRIALRLIQMLEAHLRSVGIDLCFSVVADGNQRVMPLFEGRLGIPRWASLGRFLVDELIPSPFLGRSRQHGIESAEADDLPAITMLLDRFHRSRQFSPQLSKDDLARTLSGQREEPFSKMLVARNRGRIVATLSLHDTREVKRNVLIDASASLRCALALLRIAAAPLPGFRVPRIGAPLRVLYARFVACEEGHGQALQALVAMARAEAFRRRFTFLVIGLHERDPLRSLVRGIPRFTFSSLALATSLTRPDRLESLASGIPFEDFALV